jgi:hypothetical protein
MIFTLIPFYQKLNFPVKTKTPLKIPDLSSFQHFNQKPTILIKIPTQFMHSQTGSQIKNIRDS